MAAAFLTKQQLKSFGRDGFVVLPNVVGHDLISPALKEFDRITEENMGNI